MSRILLLVLFGSLGVLAREGVREIFTRTSETFYSTLTVNLVGGFCIGFLSFWPGFHWPQEIRYTLMVGFLGGFTTYSTFYLDALKLGSTHPAQALLYVSLTLVGGLGLTAGGILLAQGGKWPWAP